MIGERARSDNRLTGLTRAARVALLGAAAGALMLVGCGGSSKPSYCSAVTNLKDSVKAVPNTDVVANGTSAVKSTFQTIETTPRRWCQARRATSRPRLRRYRVP
jgi:hypothetical protein